MNLITSGDISRATGRDRDQVNYALRKTGTKPIGRAGIVRLYPPGTIAIVKDFLDAMEAKKPGNNAA